MTEAEWFASDDSQRMLCEPMFGYGTKVTQRMSNRKLRLFACACCRQVWRLLKDERSRKAVEVAERYADGEATNQERFRAWDTAIFEVGGLVFAAARCADDDEHIHLAPGVICGSIKEHLSPAAQAALLRDIVGNPFQPVTLPIEHRQGCDAIAGAAERAYSHCKCPCPWLTPTVLSLAQAAYSGDWGTLPILADALEDVGCAESPLLNHLRSPGLHVRGCWVIDLMLGKE